MTGLYLRFRTVVPAVLCGALLACAACSGGGSDAAATGATPPGVATTDPPASTQAPTPTPAPSTAPAAGAAAFQRVVPQPATVTAADGSFAVAQSAAIRTGPGADQVGAGLAADLRKETGLSIPVSSGGDAATPGVILIDLQTAGADPAIGTEGYRLDISPTGVHLAAKTAAGLFHGVQTLRQLLQPAANGTGPATLPAGHITDFPRFAYRGAMLDVARHFMGVNDVKSYIDALALYKINYFHLHLSDDQGWRIAVAAYPKLTAVGGATQVGGGPGGFYTAADYQAIVAYAAARYMTVVPEIDMPGHVGAAVASYPELACDGRQHSVVTTVSPGFDALCVTRESTYSFVDKSLGAVAALTPGPYAHIGGDEAQALDQNAYDGFVKRAQDLAAGHGKTPMAWAEIAAGPIRPDTVAEYWNTQVPQPFVAAAAAKGTKLVMAPGDHAYLDQQYNAGFPLGLHWAGYTPVSKAYAWDPVTILPGVPPTSVLGVEAPLWTETVHNLGDAETLAFPRLPAIAEIGWSPPDTHDWPGFSARLAKQTWLWDLLGIRYYRSPEVPWS